ncbi:DUF881 domain-containing protein [Clostridium thermarum]|uniref:DUF881 domain-containing protein n=1 Tax=Clostridium thermarum TaxID=1716543 RepID=UPI0011208A90|nr:DUF881 domain-containing protein [Clostridium thermarum]
MKKILSKLAYAFVFSLLGFLLINRFIYYYEHKAVALTTNDHNQLDIVSEIELLKKEKALIEKENSEILDDIKAYEDSISTRNSYAAKVKEELETNRKILGLTDVSGPGITVYLLPKAEVFSQIDLLDSTDLYFLVNELYSASAQAISINDSRLTIQSVIADSTNQQISINDILIRPNELITIKAIGNPDLMEDDLINYDTLKFRNLKNYKVTIKKSDNLTIGRYNGKLNADGLNIVESAN